jgi:hypothetical protein
MNRFIAHTAFLCVLLTGMFAHVGIAQEAMPDQSVTSGRRVVVVCVKAWCSNSPSIIAHGVGCHNIESEARKLAQQAAAALLNCPSPNQIIYEDRACSPVTQCPDTLLIRSTASGANWKVVYTCCCRDGNTIIVSGYGKTFCDAKNAAKAEACWVGNNEHCGIRYCSWRVTEKPCNCNNCCR